MMWTDSYVGRPHTPEFDCAELCIEVERDHYGRSVSLPNRLFYEKGQNRNSDIKHVLSLFEPIEKPIDGDIVLMMSAKSLNHVGVYVVLNGKPYILHCIENSGTVLQTVPNVSKYKLRIQGYYRLKDEAVELKEELNNDANSFTDRPHEESAISA